MLKKKSLSKKTYKRKSPWKVYQLALDYIEQYNLSINPESLFAAFEEKLHLHKAFEADLRRTNMNRERKAAERRKLFIRWFFHQYASQKRLMSPFTECAELTFLSERSVELLLKEALKEEKSETTESNEEKS